MNELMLRRRNLLAKSEQGGGGDLPLIDGVVWYDNILGDNTANIPLGFGVPHDKGFRIVIDTKVILLSGTGNIMFQTYGKSGWAYTLSLKSALAFKTYRPFNGDSNIRNLADSTMDVNNIYTIDWEKQTDGDNNLKLIKNNEQLGNLVYSSTRTLTLNLMIVAGISSTIRNFKLYDENGTLTHNIHPCTYNDEIGAYDLVTNTFLPKSTNGTMTLSND